MDRIGIAILAVLAVVGCADKLNPNSLYKEAMGSLYVSRGSVVLFSIIGFSCFSVRDKALTDFEFSRIHQQVTSKSNLVFCQASIKTFGDRQLEQMLDDRPELRGVLTREDPVWKWLVDCFDGELIDCRVYWNLDRPINGNIAEHTPKFHQYPACIYITDSTDVSPVDKWACVVFEMFNLTNTKKFDVLKTEAINGAISRKEFADRCVQLEFLALKKTHDFLALNPIVVSPSEKDLWYSWVTSDLGTFEQYKNVTAGEGESKYGNFEYFGTYFDGLQLYSGDRRNKRAVEQIGGLETEYNFQKPIVNSENNASLHLSCSHAWTRNCVKHRKVKR